MRTGRLACTPEDHVVLENGARTALSRGEYLLPTNVIYRVTVTR